MSLSSTDSVQVASAALRNALGRLVRSGSSTTADIVFGAPELIDALRRCGLEGDDRRIAELVVSGIKEIASAMPAPSWGALGILLGLEDAGRGLKLGARRELASQTAGVKASTFRTHHERVLLDELAQHLALELVGSASPPMPKDDYPGDWFRWTSSSASRSEYADIATAVERFEGVETPAGAAAARWLKDEALRGSDETVTYLLVARERIEGFFSIVGGSIELTSEGSPTGRNTVGASVVLCLARHRDADPLTEPKILMYAISIALKVARLQGTAAMLLWPYDDAQAESFIDRYGFRKLGSGSPILWIPLHPK
jgi:hypothetical protein